MGPVGVSKVQQTSTSDRLRAGVAVLAARVQALSGAPVAWLLLLAGWALTSAGAWLQFGPGWSALLGGVLLIAFAATLVDVDRSRR